jgi:single-strand DNA-binding protein
MISYLKKGSAVIVTGKMNPPSSYTDKEGRTQVSLEVTAEMIEFSPFGNPDRNEQGNLTGQNSEPAYEQSSYNRPQSNYGSYSTNGSHQQSTIDDDALPF